MIRAAIMLGAAVIGLMFAIPWFAPLNEVGVAVSTRFLERPGDKPIDAGVEKLDADSLRQWVTAKETAKFAKEYAWRVIPLDLVFLAVFGGFLAVAAAALVSLGLPAPLSQWPWWLWLVCPLAYVVSDILEDVLIIVLMTSPAAISDATVTALAGLRGLKFLSSALAIAQIYLLGIAGAVR